MNVTMPDVQITIQPINTGADHAVLPSSGEKVSKGASFMQCLLGACCGLVNGMVTSGAGLPGSPDSVMPAKDSGPLLPISINQKGKGFASQIMTQGIETGVPGELVDLPGGADPKGPHQIGKRPEEQTRVLTEEVPAQETSDPKLPVSPQQSGQGTAQLASESLNGKREVLPSITTNHLAKNPAGTSGLPVLDLSNECRPQKGNQNDPLIGEEALGPSTLDSLQKDPAGQVGTRLEQQASRDLPFLSVDSSETGQLQEMGCEKSLKSGQGMSDTVTVLPSSTAGSPAKGQLQEMGHELRSNQGMSHTLTVLPLSTGEAVPLKGQPLSPLLSDGILQQIMEKLNVKTWKIGEKDLRIRLYPESLGDLRMEIGLKDHQVILRIQVENPLVKDLIEHNLVQLREGLLDKGLSMDQCSVTVGDHFQQQQGNNPENSTGSGNNRLLPPAEETVLGMPLEQFRSSFYPDSERVNVFI